MNNDYLFTDDEELYHWKLKFELEKYANIANICQIVTSSTEKNIIGTTALDTCYGIVFYDRNSKFGIVGHGLPDTKLDTLREMINMLGKDEKTIEYAIVPGYRNIERKDYSGEEQIINYLKTYCPKNIRLVPFQSDLGINLCSNCLAYEFAFDVNTSRPVTNSLFYTGENRQNKFLR